MVLDLNKYKNCIPSVRAMMNSNKNMNPIDLAGRISLATHAPIVAIAYYMADINGMTPEFQKFIDDTIEFYQYTEVRKLAAEDA